MFIPWWALGIMAVLYLYLIVTDMYLHRRVKRLEKVMRDIEGVSDRAHEEYLHQGHNGG